MTPQRHFDRLVAETGRSHCGQTGRAAIFALVFLLSGCAIHPKGELYQSTLLSYWPLNSAMRTDCPPATYINPYCYGYHETQWRPWACEWQDDSGWAAEKQLPYTEEGVPLPQKLPQPSDENEIPSASDRRPPSPVIDGAVLPHGSEQP